MISKFLYFEFDAISACSLNSGEAEDIRGQEDKRHQVQNVQRFQDIYLHTLHPHKFR
jgi:hypothetical protein